MPNSLINLLDRFERILNDENPEQATSRRTEGLEESDGETELDSSEDQDQDD